MKYNLNSFLRKKYEKKSSIRYIRINIEKFEFESLKSSKNVINLFTFYFLKY